MSQKSSIPTTSETTAGKPTTSTISVVKPTGTTVTAGSDKPKHDGRTIAIFSLLGVALVAIIIYVVVLFVCFDKQTFIFAPYTPPTPPENSFYPRGKLTDMTADEIQTRNDAINAALAQ